MLEYGRTDTGNSVDHEVDYIKELIDEWTIDDSHIRIGVVVYHDTVKEVIHIDDYKNDNQGLKNRIDVIARTLQPSGNVNLAAALDYVRGTSFKGARPGVPKVVFPIIHEMPTSGADNIVNAAERVKSEDCTFILAISTYSSNLNYDVIRKTVSSPFQEFYQAYTNYGALEFAAKYLYNKNCPANNPGITAATTGNPTRVTPTTPTPTVAQTVLNTLGTAGCNQLEVVFMIENRHGDSVYDVDHEAEFVRNLVRQWSIDDNHVRIGVVIYDNVVTETIHLQDYSGRSNDLISKLGNLKREAGRAGNAQLANALDFVRTQSFRNARSGVPKVVVAIVHRMTSDARRNFADVSQKSKQDGITVYGIGVKLSQIDKTVLQSNVDEYFEFSSFNRLEDSVPETRELICN